MTALTEEKTTNELRQAARLLRHTVTLIAEPRLWLKLRFAANQCGRPVAVDSTQTVRFCLVAAVVRAETDLYGTTCEIDAAPAWRVAMERRKRFRTALELLGEAFDDVVGRAQATAPAGTAGSRRALPGGAPHLGNGRQRSSQDDLRGCAPRARARARRRLRRAARTPNSRRWQRWRRDGGAA